MSSSRIKCLKKHRCYKDGNVYKLCVVFTDYDYFCKRIYRKSYFVGCKSFVDLTLSYRYLFCSTNYQESLKVFHDLIGVYY